MNETSSRDRWYWDNERHEFIRNGVGHPPCWSRNSVHGCDGGCTDPTFPGRRPKVGDIALCGAGYVGVITHEEPQEVTYPDGRKAVAWVGVHLGPSKVGRPWSSRNPAILGRPEDIQDETILQFVMRTVPHNWYQSQ